MPGVAALTFLRLQLQLDEAGAKALDLLFDRRTHVVGLHHGTEAARGRDRLEPGDTRPQHQDVSGSDGAGRGHQHGEELAQPVGGHEHSLVAGKRGL